MENGFGVKENRSFGMENGFKVMFFKGKLHFWYGKHRFQQPASGKLFRDRLIE